MNYTESARPKTLSEFIGKKDLKNSLSSAIKIAQINNKPFDHSLFYGPAGVGKTSLAKIIANETKSQIKIIQSSNLQNLPDLLGILTSLKPNDLLFIDEIHSLKPNLMEILYPALEDNSIDVIIGKKYNSKVIKLNLPPFTLLAATTNFGSLTKSLEERFINIFFLDSYSNEEIEDIIINISKKLNIKIKNSWIQIIKDNSRGIPRNCNRILKKLKDYQSINKNIDILKVVRECGYIFKGLTAIDIRYLGYLKEYKISGLKAISHAINLDEKTIINKIEPFLYSEKYINKTTRGRNICNKAIEVLKEINALTY